MKEKKKIVYTIEAKLEFDAEDAIDINEILDTLRGIGSAEVVDVVVEPAVDSDDDPNY